MNTDCYNFIISQLKSLYILTPMHSEEKSIEFSWQSFFTQIREWVSPKIFDTWFSPLSLLGVQSGKVLISVPNKFFKDWLEEHYGELIKKTIEKTFGHKSEIKLIISESEKKRLPQDQELQLSTEKRSTYNSILDPQNTFQNFVVGSCNQFAHAASLAVAETPAKAYNPLFIYGGVGLGKTHLLHAVGNHIMEKKRSLKISYIQSEKFVNDLIFSLQHDQMTNFRKKYRNTDVLLIDDIQFIGGKERTQEEFFHTFNTLHELNKQIIISCDRTPKEIPTLEERLRSRFEWGLIADIQPPDLETKIAILNRKAEERNLDIPDDLSLYIARNIKSNIRELEGALIRLSAYASLTNREISTNLAQEVLKEIFYLKDRDINVENIQKAVTRYFNISLTDLKSSKRNKTVTFPRQIAMYLCRKMTSFSLPEIGRQFGGKDHTTVLHSCKKISSLLDKDQEINVAIRNITKMLEG